MILNQHNLIVNTVSDNHFIVKRLFKIINLALKSQGKVLINKMENLRYEKAAISSRDDRIVLPLGGRVVAV
jgi:hypothetical protein